MSCQKNEILMHGYLDGELDLASTLQFEAHLRECVACAQAYQNYQVLRSGIRGGGLYFQLPTGLAERIRSSVRGS